MISFWVCVASFSGMAFLLVWRFLPANKLTKEDICRELTESKPFLSEFDEKIWRPLSGRGRIFMSVFWGKVSPVVKKQYCRFSNYIHGRHSLEKNGCKGYWHELNGVKKNEDEETKDEELPG